MNIQIINSEKYKAVIEVLNEDARLKTQNSVEGRFEITYTENGSEWTSPKVGITYNSDLEEDFGFRFVSHKTNIDNSKYQIKKIKYTFNGFRDAPKFIVGTTIGIVFIIGGFYIAFQTFFSVIENTGSPLFGVIAGAGIGLLIVGFGVFFLSGGMGD